MNTIIERIRKAENLITESEESVCGLRDAIEEQLDEFDENGCFSDKDEVVSLIHCERGAFFFALYVWSKAHTWLNGIENTEALLSRADACLEAAKQLGHLKVRLECRAIRTGLIEAA